MKKILLLFALPVMVMCAVSCEKEKDDSPIIWFDDPAFLQALLLDDVVDKNNDGQISEKEASAVTSLNIAGRQIVNMEEIKYFTALTSLNCSHNQLTSLDVRNNSALRQLSCDYNKLTTLDLRYNNALTYLNCSDNFLTKIILSRRHMLGEIGIQTIIFQYGDIIEYVD